MEFVAQLNNKSFHFFNFNQGEDAEEKFQLIATAYEVRVLLNHRAKLMYAKIDSGL